MGEGDMGEGDMGEGDMGEGERFVGEAGGGMKRVNGSRARQGVPGGFLLSVQYTKKLSHKNLG